MIAEILVVFLVFFVILAILLRIGYLHEMETQRRLALEAQRAASKAKVAPSCIPAPPLMANTLSRISKAASIMPATSASTPKIEKRKSSANLKVKSMVRACRKVIKRSRRASLTV